MPGSEDRLREPWPAWRWSLLLFGAALLLRAAHLATLPDSPFLARLGLDSLFHEDWGKAIAAGSWLGGGLFYQDPAYAYFLGVVYAIFGPHRLVAVAIQLALGALVAPMVFAASDRPLGRGPAIAAGILAAAYVPAIYYEGLILKTWMELFFTAAAFLALSRAIASGAWRLWAATGAALGLGCLVRGNLLLPTAALEEGPPEKAVDVCASVAGKIAAEIARKEGIAVGRTALRVAIVNFRTREDDLRALVEEAGRAARAVLAG